MKTLGILFLVAIVIAAGLGSACLPEGDTGPQGPAGPAGEQGEPGPKRDMPAHEWNGTQLRFQNPDGSWGEYTDIPQGAAGPQGAQGPQGEQGIQGIQGPAAPQGPQGERGDPGEFPSPPSREVLYDDHFVTIHYRQRYDVPIPLEAGDLLVVSFTTEWGNLHLRMADPFGFTVIGGYTVASPWQFAIMALWDGEYDLFFVNNTDSPVNLTLDVTRYPSIQIWGERK